MPMLQSVNAPDPEVDSAARGAPILDHPRRATGGHRLPAPGRADRGGAEPVEHREIIYTLAERDFRAQYKQATLGILWAVLSPVATLVIFVVVFSRVKSFGSDGIPYALYSFVASCAGASSPHRLARAGTRC